jgi:mandelate racemase
MELPSLQIRSVRARAVNAPIITPLITSRGSVDVAPLLLVDVETEEGVTGHGYAFCYMDLAAPFLVSVIERIDEMVRGEAADPRFLYKSLRGRFTLVGMRARRPPGCRFINCSVQTGTRSPLTTQKASA